MVPPRTLEALVVDRPLCFLDLESTGPKPETDRIVEIGTIIVYPLPTDGSEAKAPRVTTKRVNPGIPIPAEATAVHGITDEDVKSEPAFRQYASAVASLLEPCDFVGFNLRRFDLPMLLAEFARCGITFSHRGRRLIDLQYIYHKREPRDLGAAVRFYLGREHAAGHTAGADTAVLLELMEGQLRRYPDLPCDVEQLHAACDEFKPFRTQVEEWFGDDLTNPVFQKGKKVVGRSLREVILDDPGFIAWMLGKAEDMGDDVKQFITEYRRRMDHTTEAQRPVSQERLAV